MFFCSFVFTNNTNKQTNKQVNQKTTNKKTNKQTKQVNKTTIKQAVDRGTVVFIYNYAHNIEPTQAIDT